MAGSLLDEVSALTDETGRPRGATPAGPPSPSLLDTISSLTDDVGRLTAPERPTAPSFEEAVAGLSGEPVAPPPRFVPITPRPAPARPVLVSPPADAAFRAAGLIPPSQLGEAITPRTPAEAVSRAMAESTPRPEATYPGKPLIEGAKAGASAFAEGARNINEGLTRLLTIQPVPEGEFPLKHKMLAGKQIVDGLFSIALSAGVGYGAGLRETLREKAPQVESAPLFDPNFSAALREAMGGSPPERTPEAMAALRQPMTVGEVIDLVATLGLPALMHRVARPAGARPRLGTERRPEAPALTPEMSARLDAISERFTEAKARLDAMQAEADKTLLDVAQQRARLLPQAGDIAERHAAEIARPQSRAEAVAEAESPLPPTLVGRPLEPAPVTPGADVRSEAARAEVARLAGAPQTAADMVAARFPTVPESVIRGAPRRPVPDIRSIEASEARYAEQADAAAGLDETALIGEIARRNGIPESEARARLARGAEPAPVPPAEPPPEFLPPEVLASDVTTTLFEGWKAGESSPARKRSLDFTDWAEEVIDSAGSLEEARRIVRAEPESGSAETPGRRGVPAMRLTKAQQLAILEGLFPEGVSRGDRPEPVRGSPSGVPGDQERYRAPAGAAPSGPREGSVPGTAAPTGAEPRPAAVAPRFERTPEGDQALIPGAEARQVPEGPIRPSVPQADVAETPLFGQERAAREGQQPQLPMTPEEINRLEPPGTAPKAFGADNTHFTKERADAARERLRKLLSDEKGQVAGELSPALLRDVVDLGGFYLEGGMREFQAWSRRVVDDLGEIVRPYLQAAWDRLQKEPVATEGRKAPAFTRTAPPFFSQADAAIRTKMPERSTAEQVSGILRSSGVPAEEIKWSGIEDWLAQRQGQKATKAEVLDFLRQNDVRVEEVTLPEKGFTEPDAARALGILSWSDPVRELLNLTSRGAERGEFTVWHGSGTSPQGRVRRADITEIPGRGFVLDTAHIQNAAFTTLETAKRGAEEGVVPVERLTKFSRYTLPGGENYRELLLTLPNSKTNEALARKWFQKSYADLAPNERDFVIREARTEPPAGEYRSPHFDEPNVLAHVRFNDRTDAQGKRVLFIEELQSDWHQAGRRKGYRVEKLPEGWTVARDTQGERSRWLVRDARGYPVDEGRTADEATQRGVEWANRQQGRGAEPPPPAPFAKTWHELATKRILRWAAEHGYDKVAWTTGEQQAERYDLSMQIGAMRVQRSPDGTFAIEAFKNVNDTGQPLLVKSEISARELPDVIGKDMADKIARDFSGDREVRTYSGLDLKVGGEGMRGFYDTILPEFLNKYGKKWGARVGETRIETPATPFDESPLPAMGTIPAMEARGGTVVPSIDITPSMRRSVLAEGQPLFGGPDIAGRGREVAADLTVARERLGRLGRPEPPSSSAEGGFLRLGPRKKVETPAGTGLAEINEMVTPPPVKRGALQRVREAASAVAEAMTNRFEGARIIDQELKVHGLTRPRGEGIVDQLEIMPNAIRGNIYRDTKAVGEAYRKVYDAGLEDQLSQYLTLKQFARTIDVLATRHANDPGAQLWRRGINADTGQLVNPRGFDLSKVQDELARLDQQLSPAHRRLVDAAANEVWAVNRRLLDDAHAAGSVSDEVHALLVARGTEYVPRVVLDYLDAEGRSGGAPRGTRPLGQTIIRTLEGTERDLQEPMVATLDRIPRIRAQIEKNRARRMITDLAPQLPGVVDRVGADVFRVPDPTKTVISVFENGERVNYAVPNGVERALTYLDAQQVGFIEKFLRLGGTPLKAGATGMNVGFALTNFPRDAVRLMTFFRYGIRTPKDAVMIPVDFVRGLFTAIHTNVESVERLTERVAPGISARADALADQYYRSGAAFSTVQRNLTGEESLRRSAGLVPKREPWAQVLMTPVDILKALMEGTATFNKVVEDTAKLTGMIQAMRKGASPVAMAYEVSNFAGSPNFARAGTVGASLALLWMFYNARLQGTIGDVRRMAELPVETALKLGLFTIAPTVALWVHNRQFDGDHGREDITDNDANRYWYILQDELYQSSDGTIRRKYYKIAKEESAMAISPMIESALDWLAGADPPSAKKLAVDFGMNVLPFSNIPLRGEPTAGNVARTLGSSLLASANPWIGVPIGVGFNYDPYTQGPVVPRGLEERTLPQEQIRATTSATMIRLGNALGVSPIKLEWAVNRTTGGLGQSVLDTLDKAQGKALPAVVGDYERRARLPGFSRVLGRGGDQADRDVEDRFYRVLDEARRIKGSVTAAGERQGNIPRAMELATSPETQAKLAVADDLEGLGKSLTEMRQAQVFITHYLDASVEQKREALRALAEARHELLATFRQIETMTHKFTRLPAEFAAPPEPPSPPAARSAPARRPTAREASQALDLAAQE